MDPERFCPGAIGGSGRSREPPPFKRPYLQSRLVYRIQELAYGGLRSETRALLEVLGEQPRGGPRGRPHTASVVPSGAAHRPARISVSEGNSPKVAR
jgi:hypothetical protein